MNDTISNMYDIYHDASLAFARAERNGMRVDIYRCKKERSRLHDKMRSLEQEVMASDVGGYWKRTYGHKASVGSAAQINHIMYSHLKLWPEGEPRGSKPKADKDWLPRLKHPIIPTILEWRKWQKIADTYLSQFVRETGEDGLLHPFFNLNLAVTGRSSSDSPNFQNISKHDPVANTIVRACLLPRPGNRIIEADYSQLEVRGSVMYHKDPNLTQFVLDDFDMHTMVAKKVCCLTDSEWETMLSEDRGNAKDGVRFYCGKSGFVFAAFFGDYYGQMAPKMWRWICDQHLKGPGGMSLVQHIDTHLRSEGWHKEVSAKIARRNDLDSYEWMRKEDMDDAAFMDAAVKSRKLWWDTVSTGLGVDVSKGFEAQTPADQTKLLFYYHVERVEKWFWNDCFGVYDQWRKDFYAQYLRDGYVEYLTGFRYRGAASRNKVINAPIQGTSCHIVLYAYVQLQRMLDELGMKTLLLGQIHDSIVADVPDDETALYCALAKHAMEKLPPARWEWINVPLVAELELTPIGMPWSHKKDKDVWDALWAIDRKDVGKATEWLRKKCKWGDATIAKILKDEGFWA